MNKEIDNLREEIIDVLGDTNYQAHYIYYLFPPSAENLSKDHRVHVFEYNGNKPTYWNENTSEVTAICGEVICDSPQQINWADKIDVEYEYHVWCPSCIKLIDFNNSKYKLKGCDTATTLCLTRIES